MRLRLTLLLMLLLAALPVVNAQAFDIENALLELQPHIEERIRPDHRATQGGGMSLDQAIESVRRKTDGRIVSATTKVNKNGREVHHIKVLTKDGKVKTHKVQGRKRGDG